MHKRHNNVSIILSLGLLAVACQVDPGEPTPRDLELDSDLDEEVVADQEDRAPVTEQEVYDLLPADAEIASLKRRVVDGKALTFVKHVDDNGDIGALILDQDGLELAEADVPRAAPRTIGNSLRSLLDRRPGDPGFVEDTEEIEVIVALREPTPTGPELVERVQQGTALIDEDGNTKVTVDGRELSQRELEADRDSRQARFDSLRARRTESLRDAMRELGDRDEALARQPALERAVARGDETVTLRLPKGRVEAFVLDHDDLVSGLELPMEKEDHLSAAMQDTNVDPWALNYASRRGEDIGIYMSESGCPDYGHVTDYLRLSGSTHWHAENVSAIVRGVSPDSWLYCRDGYTLPTSADLNGYFGLPRIHIETHSWGYTTSDNDNYLTGDRSFDNHVYDTAVSVFTSNGNFGDDNGFTGSPAKALNVISVGNYNDAVDTIYSDSSFKDSEIGNEKPELSAPGTSICAGGWCATGTSMASPHAAAFAADLMGDYTWLQLRPYYVKALMLSGADKAIAGGVEKVGVGGLNFYRAYYGHTNTWWEGGNNSFSHFDSLDPLPNNGYIDREVYLSSAPSNVRIALSWLNRGWYTYDHRNDAHPIGMDMDICVYDPNGTIKGCSSSFDNPYELVSFDPVISGTYRVRISRYANRDTSSKLHMGLSINWN